MVPKLFVPQIVLTPPQIALCRLIVDGWIDPVATLIGPNHPTAKWFYRQTGRRITGKCKRFVMREAYNLLALAGLEEVSGDHFH